MEALSTAVMPPPVDSNEAWPPEVTDPTPISPATFTDTSPDAVASTRSILPTSERVTEPLEESSDVVETQLSLSYVFAQIGNIFIALFIL